MAPVNPEKRKDPPPKARRTRKKQSKEEKLASEAQRKKEGYKIQKDENPAKEERRLHEQANAKQKQ